MVTYSGQRSLGNEQIQYSLHTLPQHLLEANDFDRLHQLLSQSTEDGHNEWYTLKAAADQIAEYNVDVEAAWKVAEAIELFPQQLQYTLMLASQRSNAQNISIELLSMLVEAQVWTPKRAFDSIRQVRHAHIRMLGLARLAHYSAAIDYDKILNEIRQDAALIAGKLARATAFAEAFIELPDDCRERLADETIMAIRKSGLATRKAKLIVTLMPYLPARLFDDAFEIMEILKRLNKQAYVKTLIDFLPYSPPELRSQLVNSAFDNCLYLQDQYEQSLSLARIAHWLATAQRQKALAIVDAYPREAEKVLALSGFLADFPPDERSSTALSLLYKLSSIASETRLIEALKRLGSFLPAGVYPDVLAILEAIPDERVRAQGLIDLLPFSDEMSCGRIRDIAIKLHDPIASLRVFMHLFRQVPENEQRDLLVEVEALFEQVSSLSTRAELAVELSSFLPKEWRNRFLLKMLYSLEIIGDSIGKLKFMAALLPYIIPSARRESFDRLHAELKSIKNIDILATAYAEVIPQLSSDCQKELLFSVVDLMPAVDPVVQMKVGVSLVPYISDHEAFLDHLISGLQTNHHRMMLIEYLPNLVPYFSTAQALKCAFLIRALQSKIHLIRGLVRLAPALPDDERHSTLKDVLEYIKALRKENDRRLALLSCIEHLSEDLAVDALSIARGFHFLSQRLEALTILLDYLPVEVKGTVEEEIRSALPPLWSQARVSDATAKIAVFQAKCGDPKQALRTVQSIRDPLPQSKALTEMLPYLPTSYLESALRLAMSLPWANAKASALIAILSEPSLENRAEVVEEAVMTAHQEQNTATRCHLLVGLLPLVQKLEPGDINKIWWRSMEYVMKRPRAIAVEDLVALLPLFPFVCETPLTTEEWRDICQVFDWWK